SLREILADVDATLAARPLQGEGHTIQQIVAHVAAWEDVFRRRLQGEVVAHLSAEQDFPHAPAGEPAWQALVERLHRGNRQLQDLIRRFPDARLQEVVQGKEYTFATMIHEAPFHNTYHAGQIALLKRVLASR
ncbi:MAG TPA: DinB family protein, partial [Vicinamibacterales bacterium]|nr:DinB family protein [Vicinamibacterales bacterium]